MEIEEGTTISHYKIISAIGKGGMGEVYLARDTKLDRQAALKILPKEFADDRERMSRFVREAKSASALNHPNILTIYEIGESDGTNYIATEFIDGKTLNDYTKADPLNYRSALEIAIQVASALDEAHQAGIVHRDIKPDNIMVRSNGLAKILDFGIAKLSETPLSAGGLDSNKIDDGGDKDGSDFEAPTALQSVTTPGMIIGTANYMSPEQAKGETVDARTDIFSFGVVLYEMISGQLPFEGKSPMEIIGAVIHKEPKPLDGSEVPGEIARIIRKTLRKDRDERYQTAKGLLADLKEVKQELEFQDKLEKTVSPDKKEPETQMFKATTADESNQTTTNENRNDSITIQKSGIGKAAIGIFAILIVAVIGLGYWFYSGNSSKQIESIAVMPFVNESGNEDIEYLSDGMTETLISSLTEIPNLSVKASSTVFYYKGKNKTPKEIGEELGVEAVLLGKILQRNDELTLRLELVDSKTLDAIWSETYNRKASDLVSLQSEIARNVSDKLRLKLTVSEQKQVAKTGTSNYEAQQLYLRGRFHWNRRSVEDLQKAIGYFKQSIAKDPGYALAYVGLADTYAVLPGYGAFRPKEYGAKTRQAADKALELEKDLAEAHASLGHVLGDEYDWEGAEREFQKAIELNPNYSTAYHWYAMNLGKLGLYDEALKEITKALELDPLSRVINRNKAYLLYGADRYDEAIAQFKKTIELFPDDIQVYDNLSRAYAAQEKYSEAVEQMLIKFKLEGMPPEEIEKYKKIYQETGWKGFCRKQLEDHLKHRQEVLAKDKDAYSPDADLGLIYARLGEKEKAIEYLTKGYEERDDQLKWLGIDHEYDFIRDDPRFKKLLRKIGLSE